LLYETLADRQAQADAKLVTLLVLVDFVEVDEKVILLLEWDPAAEILNFNLEVDEKALFLGLGLHDLIQRLLARHAGNALLC
jgi:hypothetical protein